MKEGRPQKNVFNCFRLMRMHSFVHAQFPELTDYRISKMLDDGKGSDAASLRRWLSGIKSGERSETSGDKIRTLAITLNAYSLITPGSNYKEFTDLFQGILSKLHAIVSIDYVVDGTCNGSKDFAMASSNFLSHFVSDSVKLNRLLPWDGLKYLTIDDLAVDVAEVLLHGNPIVGIFEVETWETVRTLATDIEKYYESITFGKNPAVARKAFLKSLLEIPGDTHRSALLLIEMFFHEVYLANLNDLSH